MLSESYTVLYKLNDTVNTIQMGYQNLNFYSEKTIYKED
jgi:hypothetical protein